MKKVLFVTILFLTGFAAGVVTVEILLRPVLHVSEYRKALHAYKEILQINFVNNQTKMAYKAFKEGNDLKAMVYLWTVLEAGLNGSDLFKDSVSKGFDKAIDKASNEKFFKTLPMISDAFKIPHVPERSDGELAVVLERLGYKEAAREHYLIASRILNLPEDKTRWLFQTGMKNINVPEENPAGSYPKEPLSK